jgi:glycosyltransferase involved in cell wall biosynthesis
MILIVSLLEALFVRGSDFVVVRGVTFQSYFRRRFKNLAATFFYVPDSIYMMGQKPDETPANVQSLKVSYVSTYVFIDVNGDSVPRGWELVDAVAVLRGRFHVEVRVDFLGSGVAAEALKARASNAGVADLCTFSGYLPREVMLKRLRTSDVGFMEDYDTLGYRYSIGSKVQEYMSLGLPVITGCSPEKLHLLENQRLPNLLFCPPALNTSKNVEEYTDSLVRALHYATLNRNALVLAGHRNSETARQTFEWDVVASMMEDVFRAVKQKLLAKRGQLLHEKPDTVV